MKNLQEFAHIVEFAYQSKKEQFVVRFLDGSSYTIKISNLPKRLQTRKPEWENAVLSPSRNSIIVEASNKELRQIPFNTIHSRGTQI